MGITEILSWIIVGGGLGGCVEFLCRFYSGSSRLVSGSVTRITDIRLADFLGGIAVSFGIGAGSAVALQWIIIGINRFTADANAENQLYLLALSLVAGFGGRRLLPALSDKLAQDVALLKRDYKDVQILKNEMEEVREDHQKVDATAAGFQALDPRAPKFVQLSAVEELERFLTLKPLDRKATIILARLLIEIKDVAGAVRVLDRLLEAKKRAGQMDKDYADVLYNRACYKVMLWTSTDETAEKEEAYRNLEESVSISPENKADARQDEDFRPLFKENRFKNLCGVAEPTATV